jgi:hypothetical protein
VSIFLHFPNRECYHEDCWGQSKVPIYLKWVLCSEVINLNVLQYYKLTLIPIHQEEIKGFRLIDVVAVNITKQCLGTE